jgi:cytidyltransferase-related domain
VKYGFVASCFDILHPGYIRMLRDAKSQCDYLIIGLQDDPSIERPGIKNAPIFPFQERFMIMSSIVYVDEIRRYNSESELYQLLQRLICEKKIDVRILGTDYIGKRFTGDDLNIPIYFHKRDHDWSSSQTRKRIIDKAKEKV